jgi:hypothetical protein
LAAFPDHIDDSTVEIIAAEAHDRHDTEPTMSTSNSKPLQPPLPPGHGNRKALAYTSEIQRLRRLGYSFNAIRLALLDVGVVVGLSTVKREAARELGAVRLPPGRRTPQSTQPASAASAQINVGAPMSSRRTGKEIAEAFVQSHISHPLVKV